VGDDKEAKFRVMKLGQDIGFDPIDAGGLVNGRILDAMAFLVIGLAFQSGMGTQMGYKLLH
jgi:8-hydroxy-5-deazaflavin:NADPH oxidoreductase